MNNNELKLEWKMDDAAVVKERKEEIGVDEQEQMLKPEAHVSDNRFSCRINYLAPESIHLHYCRCAHSLRHNRHTPQPQWKRKSNGSS